MSSTTPSGTTRLDPQRVSVQLYTVRDGLSADLDGTLARLVDAGYERVEAFGLTEWADRLAPALRAHGLTAPSSHATVVGGDVEAVLAAAATTGTGLVVEPFVDPARWSTAEDVRAVAAELNAAAARAADAGVVLGYHNHWFELENRFGGAHALEVLADALDDRVALEVDTYWAHVGGADVTALLGRLGERVRAVHLKDGDGTRDTSAQVALGSGVVDVAAVLAAAPASALGVVELDDTRGDVVDALAASRAWLAGSAA